MKRKFTLRKLDMSADRKSSSLSCCCSDWMLKISSSVRHQESQFASCQWDRKLSSLCCRGSNWMLRISSSARNNIVSFDWLRTGVEHTSRPFIDCYSYLHRHYSIVSTFFKEAVDKKILTEIRIRLRAPSSDRDSALRDSRDSAMRASDSISNSLRKNKITGFPGNSKLVCCDCTDKLCVVAM